MRLYIVGFAGGVWWLQQQAQLPELTGAWIAAPVALIALGAVSGGSRRWRFVRRTAAALCCVACGIAWAAWFAQMRLADQLAIEWEGEDIQVVGVIATMPQPYERSVRFEFDIERVLTPHAVVPAHVAISWWGTPDRAG
ncbi:MAG TPA: DUF4131 domain-containing protein, partial [Burkholderiales bacterium]|nr:DUF4131 domain-containing protein [Burkholderiales bacterium]